MNTMITWHDMSMLRSA